ncbi:MAG: type II toxin-antitoxin system RelB/DinJ family antitoxin [Bacteroidota bacterium]|nr:type II toxin-antitoxin system RelB/DinJ family antitoxin [Bacteroidota bacterium]
MPKTVMLSTRVEPKLKKNADEIFHKLGLTTSQAVSIFFATVVNFKGIPFKIFVPNSVTKKAIEDARKKRGVKKFDTVKELMIDLES